MLLPSKLFRMTGRKIGGSGQGLFGSTAFAKLPPDHDRRTALIVRPSQAARRCAPSTLQAKFADVNANLNNGPFLVSSNLLIGAETELGFFLPAACLVRDSLYIFIISTTPRGIHHASTCRMSEFPIRGSSIRAIHQFNGIDSLIGRDGRRRSRDHLLSAAPPFLLNPPSLRSLSLARVVR